MLFFFSWARHRALSLSSLSVPRVARRAALVFALFAAGAWLSAHEGHNTAPQRPVYREIEAGGSTYRIGLAMLPQDPVIGEDVRFELQLLRMPEHGGAPAPGLPITSASVKVGVIATNGETVTLPHVGPGEKPGTYTARHQFRDSGQYGIAVDAKSGSETIAAEFPVAVSAGPILRTTYVIDAIVLLVFGALVFSRWRARQDATAPARSPMSHDAAVGVAGLAVLVCAHVWLSPPLGRMFLPERHFGPIAWDMGVPPNMPGAMPEAEPAGAPDHVDPPGTPPHTHPKGTPPHSHPGGGTEPGGATISEAREVVSTVVPVPGRLIEIMVPASARVLFEGFTPRVGGRVRRGQRLAMLEYNYILHDAVHLVNQRWLYLVPMLTAKRESLEAELAAARLHHLDDQRDAAVQQALQVMQTVEAADLAAATARLQLQRAQKLLAMHTAEITESDLVRRPVIAPIDGTIEAVNFTQGQLKYENDKLFTILDLSHVWVEARFPEHVASRQPPSRMHFVTPAFPDRQFEGRLVRVGNTLDPQTGTLSVFFDVPNPDRLLRLGMRLVAQPSTTSTAAAAAPMTGGFRRVGTTSDPLRLAPLALAGVVKAKPELSAEVTAPLWGRIEFAARRLNVGDHVKKGEDLAQVILELSADERYQMNARAVDIAAERELSRTRREQAEKRWKTAAALLQSSPDDAFRKQEAELLQRLYENAKEEEDLLVRQVGVFNGVMKKRDPKVTVVKAPIDGVITEIGFRPGELNGTDEFRRLFTIVNTSRVWLEAQMYGQQSEVVLKGIKSAMFTTPGMSSPRPLERPVAVSGAIDPDTGALSVIFEVANPGGALKIGSSAQIVVPRD